MTYQHASNVSEAESHPGHPPQCSKPVLRTSADPDLSNSLSHPPYSRSPLRIQLSPVRVTLLRYQTMHPTDSHGALGASVWRDIVNLGHLSNGIRQASTERERRMRILVDHLLSALHRAYSETTAEQERAKSCPVPTQGNGAPVYESSLNKMSMVKIGLLHLSRLSCSHAVKRLGGPVNRARHDLSVTRPALTVSKVMMDTWVPMPTMVAAVGFTDTRLSQLVPTEDPAQGRKATGLC